MTTLRSIPNQDLANIAPLPPDQKRRALEQLKNRYPPFSYQPMRRGILDILNADAGPLLTGSRTPWSQIEADIRARSRNDAETEANLRVAYALHEFSEREMLRGRRDDRLVHPLPIGVSEKLAYWSPVVIGVAGRPCIPFIDPRKSKTLTSAGRRFAFSAMHERIRESYLDFAEVGFLIIQFETTKDGLRKPILRFDDDVDRFSFEQLDEMTRETYQIWHDILVEREETERRSATGTDNGPLFR